MDQKKTDGTYKPPPRRPGSTHGLAKLTEEDVLAIRADTRKYRDIAAAYGVSYGLIGHIKARRAWRHI